MQIWIFVHNMFSPCSAKRRASDKDLPVQKFSFYITILPNLLLKEVLKILWKSFQFSKQGYWFWITMLLPQSRHYSPFIEISCQHNINPSHFVLDSMYCLCSTGPWPLYSIHDVPMYGIMGWNNFRSPIWIFVLLDFTRYFWAFRKTIHKQWNLGRKA